MTTFILLAFGSYVYVSTIRAKKQFEDENELKEAKGPRQPGTGKHMSPWGKS